MGGQHAHGGWDAHMHLDQPGQSDGNHPTMQENYESNVFNNHGPNFFDNVQPFEKNENDLPTDK